MPTYSYLNDILASTAELNILDGCTCTYTELNILDGVTATTAEVNLLDVSTASGASSSTFLRGDASWQAVEHLTVRNAGTTLTERSNLKFDGTHVIATDDSGNDETDITLSANLQALSGLTSAANKGIQFTGSGTAAVYDLTTAGKALLDDANAAAQRTTLGSVIGTDVQAFDADLLAIAGLTSAADKGIQFTGSGAAAVYDLTTAGKALLDDADAAAQRVTLGLGNVNNIADASQVSVGALNAGSITSGFTSIDVGAGAITTTGTISAGTLTVTSDTTHNGNVIMNKNKKIQQRGAFLQSSTHQALVFGT